MAEVWLYCEIDQECRRPSFLDFVEKWGPVIVAKRLEDNPGGDKCYVLKVTKGTAEALLAGYHRHEPTWHFGSQLNFVAQMWFRNCFAGSCLLLRV
jgi:hypothetical protein